MKEVLKKLRVLEAEMEEAENQSEYWMEEEHLDMEKSNSYEAEADRLYQEVYKMHNQVADFIVSLTSGQIDKVTAMLMMQLRQSGSEKQRRRRKAMALLEVKTEWAVYKDCFLQVARYQADNSRAIEIWNNEDGPIARITVCITGSGLAEDETVIDTNNCPWAMEFIKQHGFGQATGRMVKAVTAHIR